MQEERDVKKTSVLIPFLIGGLAGAGIALLLAPKSGREVRSDIKEYAAGTKDALDRSVDEGRRIYRNGKIALEKAVGSGKSA